MKKLLIANWKMNPVTLDEARDLFDATEKFAEKYGARVVVAPPFTHLEELINRALKKEYEGIHFGAQDAFWEDAGAFTGEISPKMLRNLGVSYAIIGHSERRMILHETDEMINKKIIACEAAGLKVILCVGEPREVRDKGLNAAKDYVKSQLEADLKNIQTLYPIPQTPDPIIVAYEPIWAIGTGVPDKPQDSANMARFIKELLMAKPHTPKRASPSDFSLNPLILYGGSVTASNAELFLSEKDIDGALVGGASLSAEEFGKIIKIATEGIANGV
ncbi:MAG: triose-phosphate isomerase [Candidatus Liptonbacteria bacterium]|nr:triose-phosphate isomerase [Candidatus Liptonbacteria bacterium]